MKITPVILCGGSGTRLWPLSRSSFPKQFLELADGESLLQATLRRLPAGASEALIISNAEHRFLVAEQCKSQPDAMVVLEPVARNTAPAIAAAAFIARQRDPDAVMLVLPSDHLIRDTAAFHRAVEAAYPSAVAGKIVTFGIVPDQPNTGYGYIQRGTALAGDVYAVQRFVEKPDHDNAVRMIDSGDYYWNSGMFLLKASTYLDELARFQPQMHAQAEQSVLQARQDLDFFRLDPTTFAACPSDSIDYAVMERTASAAVVASDFGWSDIGSWTSLAESLPHDEQGNVLRGDVVLDDSRNCLVMGNHRLVTATGVDDLIIIETSDAVLVAHKDKSQSVKKIVEQLQKQQRAEAHLHRQVYRPWGTYEGVDDGDRYQVKRITVKPGASLSLQMHHHRAEHWIVVKGTARVTCGDKVSLLTENQSTYIPLGEVHRLENPGKVMLELIEVQSGSYLGEDDIVRFEDTYGRN